MKHPNLLFSILALALFTTSAYGQEAMLRKGDRLYEQYSFAEAITAYERAFELGAEDLGAARRLADSYRRVRDLGSSEQWYALIAGSGEVPAQDLYNYADALRANGKYAKADSVMHLFASATPADSRGKAQAFSATTYGLMIVDPYFEGKLVPVAFNSTEMDMGPSLMDGHIVFASTRVAEASMRIKYAWDGQAFLNLYIEENGKPRLLKGSVNTRFHESNATFNTKGTEMFFTRNGFQDGHTVEGSDGFNNLHIYCSKLKDGAWTEGEPFVHNDPGFSTGHPSLSSDGRTLYFASNRPGGLGGVDIWVSQRDAHGAWQAPRNLGPEVNTEGDELFPAIHNDNALFFTSDGRMGLGGHDVYLAWIFNGEARSTTNLGAPVNSRSDDMGFALLPDGRTGYFSSDRAGGNGGTDILRIDLDTPFERRIHITGRVFNREDETPLARIPIRITGIDNSLIARDITKPDGSYSFTIPPRSATLSIGGDGPAGVELPLDEFMLEATDHTLSMPDVKLSPVFDVPVTLRLLDKVTGLPVSNANVTLRDPANGETHIDGRTDAYGIVNGALRDVELGHQALVHLQVVHQGKTVASSSFPVDVESREQQALERQLDLGAYTAAVMIEPFKSRFRLLEDSDQDMAGSVWSGTVKDRSDGLPIAHVPVTLLDIRGAELARTSTDAMGRYLLRSVEVPFTVKAAIPGGAEAELTDISPFGDAHLPDLQMNGVMDLPVNAMITDAMTGSALPGVVITITDKRDGQVLYTGTSNALGVSTGTLADRRFGSDQLLEVTFSKEGYEPMRVDVDFSVLAFMDQSLGGKDGFRMLPSMMGMDIGEAMHMRPILFDYNSAAIRSDAAGELDLLAQLLRVRPGLRIELRSHTDSRGGEAFNRFLSLRRAQSVRDYLIAEGITGERLVAKGLGETELVNHCVDGVTCSEEEHQDNRRTEFLVTTGSTTDMVITH